jgi:hypothetical protein
VYSHATLFSPAISTLEQALKRGYIRNFPRSHHQDTTAPSAPFHCYC